jgi:hypothetical protein
MLKLPIDTDLCYTAFEEAIRIYHNLHREKPTLLLCHMADQFMGAKLVKDSSIHLEVNRHFPPDTWMLVGPKGIVLGSEGV